MAATEADGGANVAVSGADALDTVIDAGGSVEGAKIGAVAAATGRRREATRSHDTRYGAVTLKEVWQESGGIGLFLWGAGAVLARYLEVESAFGDGAFRGKRVVELGAGAGLCGLVAYAAGAKDVVLTDTEEHIDLLKQNIELNSGGPGCAFPGAVGTIRAQELVWGDDAQIAAIGDVDLVLGADIVYNPAAFPALVRTLGLLLRSGGGEALIAFTYRKAEERQFFAQLLDARLAARRIPPSQLHPDSRAGDDMGVFLITAPDDWI